MCSWTLSWICISDRTFPEAGQTLAWLPRFVGCPQAYVTLGDCYLRLGMCVCLQCFYNDRYEVPSNTSAGSESEPDHYFYLTTRKATLTRTSDLFRSLINKAALLYDKYSQCGTTPRPSLPDSKLFQFTPGLYPCFLNANASAFPAPRASGIRKGPTTEDIPCRPP